MPSGPDRATRKRWRRRFREFDRGHLTVAEFCRREAVAVSSFYRWRDKLARGPAASGPLRSASTTRWRYHRSRQPEPPWLAWASVPLSFREPGARDLIAGFAKSELIADRFEIQLRGTGTNWRVAVKTVAESRTVKLSDGVLRADDAGRTAPVVRMVLGE